MKTFEQIAKDCADSAVKYKRQFKFLTYFGIGLIAFDAAAFITCIYFKHYWDALPLLIIGLFVVHTTRDCIKHGKKSFNSFMKLRDECLDLAHKTRGY